ncbi:Golgi mannosyltransferase complex subunit [Podila minutissima]|uniref:Golgi mannosyltransferase complex subunit n=1 Tax=Podila minutissima TaxID=64525 RepID=A0A9P5SH57_9FUNG|nr:Golgi mannosyltransferase complex subunit [Podila minutissima]
MKNNMKGGANDTCPALVKATKLQSFNLDNIHTYLSGPSTNHTSPTDTVLILTPLMDAVPFLERYFSKLATIDYPKELLSLGFLVSTAPDQEVDPTLQAVEKHTSQLDNSSDYRRITLLQQKSKSTQRYEERHEYDRQTKRRQTLARCRNALVTTALLDESWVLWLDVDVVEYAPTLLLELMRFNKDIIAPNCFRKIQSWPTTKNEPYDRNNWIETTESLAEQQVLDEDDILYEGYEYEQPTYRLSMADMDEQSPEIMPIDGIGGTFTLVKALVHRSGVGFPTFPVNHQIETEGFAKWAKREGFSVWGAPRHIVMHA